MSDKVELSPYIYEGKITTIANPTNSYPLVIHAGNNVEPIVIITPEGKLLLGDDIAPDEAARQFCDYLLKFWDDNMEKRKSKE